MNRILDYKKLSEQIQNWIVDYVNKNNIETLVIGVSGGIEAGGGGGTGSKGGVRQHQTIVGHQDCLGNRVGDRLGQTGEGKSPRESGPGTPRIH